MTNTLLLQNLISLQQKIFKAKLEQADLVIKTEFDTKLHNISKRITSSKS